MQHAEKEKKKREKVLKHKFQIFPHKLKKESKVPQKKSTYKLKRNLNYTEMPELHLTNTYIQKRKSKHQKFPFKLITVCGSLKQDQICNFYWNRSILLTWTKYKKVTCSSFGLPLIICVYQVWQHPYCIPLNS